MIKLKLPHIVKCQHSFEAVGETWCGCLSAPNKLSKSIISWW